MRTLTDCLFIAENKSRERLYSVQCEIVFTCEPIPAREQSEIIEKLRLVLVDCDTRFPWINGVGGANERIHDLSDGEMMVTSFRGVTEHRIRFTFIPRYYNIPRGHLHAYEKYLEKLASELHGEYHEYVKKVQSIFQVASSRVFFDKD